MGSPDRSTGGRSVNPCRRRANDVETNGGTAARMWSASEEKRI